MMKNIGRGNGNFEEWGDKSFGKLYKNIKGLKKKLQDLQVELKYDETLRLVYQTKKQLDDLFELREIHWAQRSCAVWLKHDDKNSNFFNRKLPKEDR